MVLSFIQWYKLFSSISFYQQFIFLFLFFRLGFYNPRRNALPAIIRCFYSIQHFFIKNQYTYAWIIHIELYDVSFTYVFSQRIIAFHGQFCCYIIRSFVFFSFYIKFILKPWWNFCSSSKSINLSHSISCWLPLKFIIISIYGS